MLGLPKRLLVIYIVYNLLLMSIFIVTLLNVIDVLTSWIILGIVTFSYLGFLYIVFSLRNTKTLARKIHVWLSS